MRRVARSAVLAVLLFVLPTPALAMPSPAEIDARTISLGIGRVTTDQGDSGFAIVLAYENEHGSWLRVRICAATCTDYSKQLDGSEYTHSATNNRADVTAAVEGLGDVNLTNYSTSTDARWRTCADQRVATAFVVMGSGVAQAGIEQGGTLGPWHFASGVCGLNARDSTLLQLSL